MANQMDSASSLAEKLDGMEIEFADQNTAANLGSSSAPDRSTQTDSNHAVTSQLQTSQHSTSVLVKANDPPTLTSLEITDIVTFMNKYETTNVIWIMLVVMELDRPLILNLSIR